MALTKGRHHVHLKDKNMRHLRESGADFLCFFYINFLYSSSYI